MPQPSDEGMEGRTEGRPALGPQLASVGQPGVLTPGPVLFSTHFKLSPHQPLARDVYSENSKPTVTNQLKGKTVA